jgi:hypothetical protein
LGYSQTLTLTSTNENAKLLNIWRSFENAFRFHYYYGGRTLFFQSRRKKYACPSTQYPIKKGRFVAKFFKKSIDCHLGGRFIM